MKLANHPNDEKGLEVGLSLAAKANRADKQAGKANVIPRQL